MSCAYGARLPTLLTALRLPTIRNHWETMSAQADAEGWTGARLLSVLAELELAERSQRRIGRHLEQSRLPTGKSFESFDFGAVPMLRRAHLEALASGDSWLASGQNVLMFGPPGAGKTHLAAGLGRRLIDQGYRVFFTRTTDLVQRLQTARRELSLPSAIEKLDKFDLLILDDLSYVEKDQAETSVLFELISARYERKSLLITANQPFGAWDRIFPDPSMTVAAIDRLVHHATIFEMNVESYRRRSAVTRSQAAKEEERAG